MPTKCKNLEAVLRSLPTGDVPNFVRHFGRFYIEAFKWDLWAAAFIIGEGCSNDSFMDFRSTLISMGQTAFTKALVDPETLVETNIHPDWAHYQGYQYVGSRLWNEMVGENSPPDPNHPEDQQKHPREPAGQPFVEWELSKKFPRLAAKFNYKDSDWYFERDRQHKDQQKQKAAEEVADLILRNRLIPPGGLIAPYKLLREALKSGDARQFTGIAETWNPIDLDEGIYWASVVQLENLSPQKLAEHPHLKTDRLKVDVTTAATTFAEWIHSRLV